MDLIDRLLGRVDEGMLSRLITHWRQGVWDMALRLLAAPDAAAAEKIRQEVENEMEIGRWLVRV